MSPEGWIAALAVTGGLFVILIPLMRSRGAKPRRKPGGDDGGAAAPFMIDGDGGGD